MNKKTLSRLLTCLGFLFLIAYIRSATCDVVYTDYIRLTNSYLNDVFSFRPYLRGDILTRTPICYIERIINVSLFRYSTFFDMILGVASLSLSGLIVMSYGENKRIGFSGMLLLALVIFSLDKWEMITNGTGWIHFFAVASFYYYYILYDRTRRRASETERRLIIILPFVYLFIGGPYIGAFLAATFVVFVIDYYSGMNDIGKGEWIVRLLSVIIPTVLYIISSSFVDEMPSGLIETSLLSAITSDPVTLVKMGIKSFAAVVIGGETVTAYAIPGKIVLLTGLIVIAVYLYAILINFRSGLYRQTVIPMLLIVSAIVSHGCVFLSRYGFMNDIYGMSSRYSLQYMSGPLGVILSFFLVSEKDDITLADRSLKWLKMIRVLFVILLLAGQLTTIGREIHMAKYRKEAFIRMTDTALNYRDVSNEDLKSILQYRDPDKTREALSLLEEKKLNVFK